MTSGWESVAGNPVSHSLRFYRLDEICHFVKGVSRTLDTEPGQYPMVVTADFRRSSSEYQIDGNAVCIPLISSTGHGDAALHRLHYQEGRFALANLLVALLPKADDAYFPKYLYWYLTTHKDRILVPLMQGTANVSLKERDIAKVSIPLPPLEEQRRIVARVEALAARIEEARGLRINSSVKTEFYQRSYQSNIFSDIQGWPVVALESVCSAIIDNLHSNPVYEASEVPCIRSSDVGWGKLILATARRTSEEEYTRRTIRGEPKPDDIVLVREGGGTGKAALVESHHRFSLGQRVMMLRPDQSRVLPKFMLHQILSPAIFEEQISKSFKGSASPHLNIGSLRKFRFFLPSLEQQKKTLQVIEATEASIDTLERLQTSTRLELDALLPAVLAKAFAGEL